MPSPTTKEWASLTLLVENDWGEFGTGFLVSKEFDSGDENYFIKHMYLVTNKHVIGSTKQLRDDVESIKLYGDFVEDGESKKFILDLEINPGGIQEHPSPDVDVAAIRATGLFKRFPETKNKCIPITAIKSPSELATLNIGAGDRVLIYGYPGGIAHANINAPFIRTGIISSQLGEPLVDQVDDEGQSRVRTIKGFLVDGGVVPGQSGSPVIWEPPVVERENSGLVWRNRSPELIGIIAETRYAPIDSGMIKLEGFAGLGLAFDADTIKETIELFDECQTSE
ncbi:trypsin-like peptidase domain-containing protein [Dehalococcoides mccartyi]|nr:trypsin-like peptidase domain-containing protein [Dehalococcoides mccartyi]